MAFTTLALASLLLAVPPEVHRRAVDHYRVGADDYADGEYAAALKEFKTALQLEPVPNFLFNIAQCQRQLGLRKEAIESYEEYLSAEPNAPNRATVTKFLNQLKELSESAAPAPPPVVVQQAPPPAVAAVPPAALTAAPAPAPKRSIPTGAWWLGGAGVAAAVAGGALLGAGYGTLPGTCGSYGTSTCYRSSTDGANALGYAGQAGLIAGGALLVGAVVWALVAPAEVAP